ncbi:MAG: carboxylesterase family protein [Ruminococcaceae bacterium]|jgi:para-nitrobenzyl esterase|nr:carboxylesterase family protein [Oscillospiraceae bacterium]
MSQTKAINTIELTTALGKIRGVETENCIEFRGIRYATAERWKMPVPVTKWDGVYDATEFGACCYQNRAFTDDSVTNPFYHKEFRKGLDFTYSEDCLFLNIWKPKDAGNCPVLVYIHGGSFTGGSCDEGHIRGDELAKDGIMVVAMNYRLGPYGFCCHPDLRDENGICGNYGLFDQVAALKWIKENIADYGGDPDNMTLSGESAGAMSVDIQLSNPDLDGMFKGAVLMSGIGMQRFILKPITPEKNGKDFWDKIIAHAGVNNIEELRCVDPKKLFEAWEAAQKEVKLAIRCTLPAYDGYILKPETFNIKSFPDMPYLLGVTTNDMFPYFLMRNTKKLANYASRNFKNKCFIYCFGRALPGDDVGAWHASDLLYAFKKLDFNYRNFEPVDYEIADKMSASLVAFVKNQNPNNEKVPRWDSGSEAPMHFDVVTEAKKLDSKLFFRNTVKHNGPI